MAWRQSAGFTRYNMFFDDAWAALPARVHLGDALKMTVSTPGWTLLLREWIHAGSYATWWAQVPALIGAIVMGVVFFALTRYFRLAPWPSALATVLLVSNPTTLTYATRVKPYTWEMVLAISILALGEWVRRTSSRRSFVALGVGSVVAFLLSFATAIVIAGVWCAVLVWLWSDRTTRRHAVTAACVSAAGVLAVGVPFVLATPPSLGDRWVGRGFMANFHSLRGFGHNLVTMLAGFANGLSGLSVGYQFRQNRITPWDDVVAVAVALVILGLLWWTAGPRAWREKSPLLAVGFVLLVALAAGATDVFPFGDGRTDEVLYPAVFLAVAVGLDRLLTHRPSHVTRSLHVFVAAVVVVVSLGAASWNATANAAKYPELNLTGLMAKLRPQLRPGDAIVVPSFLSFPWAQANLSSWTVDFNTHGSWPQGFRVASTSKIPVVVLPETYAGFDPQLAQLRHHFHRVWYVGYTLGVWNPYVVDAKYPALLPMQTYTLGQLLQEGWHPQFFATTSLNCYAEPYVL